MKSDDLLWKTSRIAPRNVQTCSAVRACRNILERWRDPYAIAMLPAAGNAISCTHASSSPLIPGHLAPSSSGTIDAARTLPPSSPHPCAPLVGQVPTSPQAIFHHYTALPISQLHEECCSCCRTQPEANRLPRPAGIGQAARLPTLCAMQRLHSRPGRPAAAAAGGAGLCSPAEGGRLQLRGRRPPRLALPRAAGRAWLAAAARHRPLPRRHA